MCFSSLSCWGERKRQCLFLLLGISVASQDDDTGTPYVGNSRYLPQDTANLGHIFNPTGLRSLEETHGQDTGPEENSEVKLV